MLALRTPRLTGAGHWKRGPSKLPYPTEDDTADADQHKAHKLRFTRQKEIKRHMGERHRVKNRRLKNQVEELENKVKEQKHQVQEPQSQVEQQTNQIPQQQRQVEELKSQVDELTADRDPLALRLRISLDVLIKYRRMCGTGMHFIHQPQ